MERLLLANGDLDTFKHEGDVRSECEVEFRTLFPFIKKVSDRYKTENQVSSPLSMLYQKIVDRQMANYLLIRSRLFYPVRQR